MYTISCKLCANCDTNYLQTWNGWHEISQDYWKVNHSWVTVVFIKWHASRENTPYAVIINYAAHVRHDIEMSCREFKHCWTFCLAVVNVKEMSSRKNKGCRTFSGSKMSSRELKCPAEHWMSARHFVWHGENNFDNHWIRNPISNIWTILMDSWWNVR